MVDRVDTAKASQLFTKEEVVNAGFKDVEMNEFEGGVNTSDAKIVKQYFHYYAKLQN